MHYWALVILPENFEPSSLKKVTDELFRLISPYKEGNVPEGLMTTCDCIQTKAFNKAKKRVTDLCQDFRKALLSEVGCTEEQIQMENINWRAAKQFEAEYVEEGVKSILSTINPLASSAARKYVPYEKPNADCKMCNGSGKMREFFNPNEKWDMFNLASKGVMSLHDVCSRDKDGVFTNEIIHKWLKCNMQKVSDFKDDYNWQAVITPDGEWHDRDDHDEEGCFEDHLKKLFDQHMNCYLLVCDMHH